MRSDGKRPDGAMLGPWKSGCLLVWDATCPDTLAASYRVHATSMPEKVAATAEERKSRKYRGLPPGHLFAPIAIETLGAIGPRSLAFLKELGRRIRGETGEPRSTVYVVQRLSVAVLQWNCIVVLGSTGYRLLVYVSTFE